MSVHDDFVYVRHILRATEKARTYTDNLSEAEFMAAMFREQHNEVPWSHMARMRDVLIHHYWEVDLDIVWTTLTKDLPRLEPLLRAVLHE